MPPNSPAHALAPLVFALTLALPAGCGLGRSDQTPAAMPAPTMTATVAPSPTLPAILSAASVPLPPPGAGEFFADCPAIRIRIIVLPRLMANPGACQGNSLFLTPNIATPDTEFLTVFRYADDARGGTAAGWADILDAIRRIDATSGDTAWSADDQPTMRRAGARDGFNRDRRGIALRALTRANRKEMRQPGEAAAGEEGGRNMHVGDGNERSVAPVCGRWVRLPFIRPSPRAARSVEDEYAGGT